MKCTKKKEKYYQFDQVYNLQKITSQCQETIQVVLLEKEELQRMFTVISDKIRCLSTQNNTLTKEQKVLQSENDEFEYFITEKQKILKDLIDFLSILSSENFNISLNENSIKNINQIIQTYTPRKQRIGQELVQNIKKDKSQIQQLSQFLQYIENKTSNLQDQQQYWKCIRCQRKLQEGTNEKNCKYHSGKLKYFSCRLCGADEYFTCCNQCRDCNQGCTIGLHKP